MAFDVAEQFVECADAVLHEDSELAKARPVAPAHRASLGPGLAPHAHQKSPGVTASLCGTSLYDNALIPSIAGIVMLSVCLGTLALQSAADKVHTVSETVWWCRSARASRED